MAISTSLPLRRSPAAQLGALHYSGRHERMPRDGRPAHSGVPRLNRQIMRFGSIGVLSTVLHLGLFVAFQRASGATQAANLAALLAATVVNTALNRRWTFGITGASRALRHQLQGLVVFGVTWASSAIALWLLMYVSARPSTIDQGLTVAVAMVISTVVRFVAMRSWMFGSHPGATVQA